MISIILKKQNIHLSYNLIRYLVIKLLKLILYRLIKNKFNI